MILAMFNDDLIDWADALVLGRLAFSKCSVVR